MKRDMKKPGKKPVKPVKTKVRQKPVSDSPLGHSPDDWLHYNELSLGIVRMASDISDFETENWLREIDFLGRKLKKGDTLQVLICSAGGGAYNSFALYDALRKVSGRGIRVVCCAQGFAASAAAMIVLQAGDKRIASPNTRFILHEIARDAIYERLTKSSMEDEAREMKILQDIVLDILESRTGKSRKMLSGLVERKETYLSAVEALEWHLIDEIDEV